MNKKAEAATAIIIVIIIIVFLGWLINVGNRECNSNGDCKDNYYCGVDYNCHQIPVIEKEIVIQNNYVWPSVIIGMSIIVAAVILRYRRNGKKEEASQEDKAPEEPYYKNF